MVFTGGLQRKVQTKNKFYHKTSGTLHSITNSMNCTVKNQKMVNLHEIQCLSN